LLTAEGASVGLAVALLLLPGSVSDYVTRNAVRPRIRLILLNETLAIAAGLLLVTVLPVVLRRQPRDVPKTLLFLGRRLAPLGVLSFLPLLFRWPLWEGRDLQFLALAGAVTLLFGVAVRTSADAGPSRWELRVKLALERFGDRVRARAPRLVA